MGMQSLQCGDASVVVCGGMESMSRAPHALLLRSGVKMGNATMTDTMNHDGLTDAFLDYHMGVTGQFHHPCTTWASQVSSTTPVPHGRYRSVPPPLYHMGITVQSHHPCPVPHGRHSSVPPLYHIGWASRISLVKFTRISRVLFQAIIPRLL